MSRESFKEKVMDLANITMEDVSYTYIPKFALKKRAEAGLCDLVAT